MCTNLVLYLKNDIFAKLNRMKMVVAHIHTHQFRHSMATHLIDDGVNVFSVSKFLGHKSVSTTMKYIGITPKMTEKAMTQIESTSSLQMPQKWKKPATLADLIK